MADLADILTISGKFQDLRRRSVRWPGRVAAAEYEDGSFRINGDFGSFTEMQVRWEIKEIRNGIERYFRPALQQTQDSRIKASQWL